MNINNNLIIDIYTDGSCDTQHRTGAWVAIILWSNEKQIISGTEINTTHNRMELLAVIEACNYVNKNFTSASIRIYSDSQYVTELPQRKQKLQAANFFSKKGTHIQNHLLVQSLFEKIAANNVTFEKVKAHQKKTDIINYNIEADLLVRKTVRESVRML